MCNEEQILNKNEEKERGDIMSVLAKPVNLAFRVRKEKAQEFLNEKRNTKMLIEKFERLKKIELKTGKSENDSDIISLTNKINELKKEL